MRRKHTLFFSSYSRKEPKKVSLNCCRSTAETGGISANVHARCWGKTIVCAKGVTAMRLKAAFQSQLVYTY